MSLRTYGFTNHLPINVTYLSKNNTWVQYTIFPTTSDQRSPERLRQARSLQSTCNPQKYSRAINVSKHMWGHLILTTSPIRHLGSGLQMQEIVCIWGQSIYHSYKPKWHTDYSKLCRYVWAHVWAIWSVYNSKWDCIRDGTGDLWVTISYSWASNTVWKWLWPLSSHDMDISWLCSALSEDHTLICL